MNSLTACHDCDALYRLPELSPKEVARCVRCGAELNRYHGNSQELTLSLTITGIILFWIANLNPLLIMKLGGRIQVNTLWAGVEAMAREGMWDLAILVFATSQFFPFLLLSGLTLLLCSLRFGIAMRWSAWVFRLVLAVTPWAMVGVYMLGIFVAYVKLTSMAMVLPGVAAYAFFALLMITAAARATLDTRLIWNQLPLTQGNQL